MFIYIYMLLLVYCRAERIWFRNCSSLLSQPLMSIIHWPRIIGTKVLLLFLVQLPRLSRRHGARPALPVGVHAPPARA